MLAQAPAAGAQAVAIADASSTGRGQVMPFEGYYIAPLHQTKVMLQCSAALPTQGFQATVPQTRQIRKHVLKIILHMTCVMPQNTLRPRYPVVKHSAAVCVFNTGGTASATALAESIASGQSGAAAQALATSSAAGGAQSQAAATAIAQAASKSELLLLLC
jgi:hypothetical protein